MLGVVMYEGVNGMQYVKTLIRPCWRSIKHASLPRLLRVPQARCPLQAIGGREGDPDHFGRLVLNPHLLSSDSVVYAFGVGDDISFDLSLVNLFGATVHAFDPAPNSIAWARAQRTPPAWILHEFGISNVDGEVTFYPPDDPNWIADTVHATQYSSKRGQACPVYRLTTIMDRLGHSKVDLLKMNIEGAEYAVIDDLVQSGIVIKQLLVSFHHHFKGIGRGKTKSSIRALNDVGYRTSHISYNGEEVLLLHERCLAQGEQGHA